MGAHPPHPPKRYARGQRWAIARRPADGCSVNLSAYIERPGMTVRSSEVDSSGWGEREVGVRHAASNDARASRIRPLEPSRPPTHAQLVASSRTENTTMMPTTIRSFVAIGAIAGAALIAACASAGGGAKSTSSADRRANCLLRSEDSIYLQGGEVYRDCAVDKQASVVTPGVHPDFHVFGPTGGCYTAEWEFVVGENGIPESETERLLHASDEGFAESVHAMLGNLRYQPATRDGNAVRQIVVRRESAQVRTDYAVGSAGAPSSGTSTPTTGSGSSSSGQQPGSTNPGAGKPTVPTGPPMSGAGTAPASQVIWGRC